MGEHPVWGKCHDYRGSRVRLALDGTGRVRVQTGAGIYDHFLEQLAFHAGFDLALDGVGDVETGPHHTAEDAALALGEALDRALGDRRGIARYGDAVVPMDDALARAAVDLTGTQATVRSQGQISELPQQIRYTPTGSAVVIWVLRTSRGWQRLCPRSR